MDGISPISDGGWQIADLSPVANPPSAGIHPSSNAVDPADQKKQQVAKDFESILLTRLFAQVQQTMSGLNPEEDGTGQQVQGLFWFYLARDAADKGGFGLWKEIYQHLQQMGQAPNPADALNEEL
jgi:Rod binding domain-containing protein